MPGRVRILARKSPAIRYAKFGEHQYVGSLKTTVTSGPSTCTWSMKPSFTNGSSSSGSSTSAIAAYTCASVIPASWVSGQTVGADLSPPTADLSVLRSPLAEWIGAETLESSGGIQLLRWLGERIIADLGE